jgi:acetyl-CoA synthetase
MLTGPGGLAIDTTLDQVKDTPNVKQGKNWRSRIENGTEIVEMLGDCNVHYDEKCGNGFCLEDVKADFDWHRTGKVNIAYEAIDRHARSWRKNKVCLYWEGADGCDRKYTFQEFKIRTDKFANVLRKAGVKKGDRVIVYLPRIPELYASAISIAKLGAIFAPLFGGFRAEAVRDRINDAQACMVITTPEMKRLGIDPIRKDIPSVKSIVLCNIPRNYDLEPGDLSYDAEMIYASEEFEPEWCDLEDPVIMHYTSGTTGKSKGVVHVHNAMIGHYITTKWVQDLRDDDVYWCTADPGWVTGTSYGIFGPWLNGGSQVVYAGKFSPESWYWIVEKYKVTVWYTAPTALRMLMKAGDDVPKKYHLDSLRYITSVGEPLNPEVIRWAMKVYGPPIHENYWMTETGSNMIANFYGLPLKIGSMGKAFPGIDAAIIDDTGRVLPTGVPGNIAIKPGWPSMMRSIWNNPEKYKEYFRIPGWYVTGDSGFMDKDGYFWFTGRMDDVIKTSGERVGPFEVESALLEHPAVAEAGVIGKPDPLYGNVIKAFISLKPGYTGTEELKREISESVKKSLAAHAFPREIEFKDNLPKTRSGKIMRRVLKAMELGQPLGDLATLDDD